jgi:hypothetical protein
LIRQFIQVGLYLFAGKPKDPDVTISVLIALTEYIVNHLLGRQLPLLISV